MAAASFREIGFVVMALAAIAIFVGFVGFFATPVQYNGLASPQNAAFKVLFMSGGILELGGLSLWITGLLRQKGEASGSRKTRPNLKNIGRQSSAPPQK